METYNCGEEGGGGGEETVAVLLETAVWLVHVYVLRVGGGKKGEGLEEIINGAGLVEWPFFYFTHRR